MKTHDQRLEVLEQRFAADVRERILQNVAQREGIDPEELRAEAERYLVEARAFPSPEAHIAHVAESLGMSVADLEDEARRLEAAALAEVAA